MNDVQHLAHGLAGDQTAPDWPPLTNVEIDRLLRGYPSVGRATDIQWHSPRPLSAACLVDTDAGRFFVKRHHCQVRSVESLREEHRFIAHLRGNDMPIPAVIADEQGQTAVMLGDWVYEIHAGAQGQDIYREMISWTPLPDSAHAITAGRMLATLHSAAEGYQAAQRQTHVLVARSELICAADLVAALTSQLLERPGLAAYLRDRDWQHDFAELLSPWHAAVQSQLALQPRLWTHGDWHVSNLCWSSEDAAAQISTVLDFGLCAANFALFDLATAIERNAISWLNMDTEPDAGQPRIAAALIEGYRRQRPLSVSAVHLLADLLPLVHVDFALSEVAYYHAITRSQANANVAYETFLLGHAAWFRTPPGRNLLQAIRDCA
jgi:Ser/Thr protein kinase RdoA (MazF antagonist)